ncbi:LysR family transcriptional regulator [Pantoea sp. 18069]|uniref:LysR family transcriptional regulator n=1 Tax=Pantoea sp. 18069 TaxID=2681415 RepID=UPI00135738B0|nr:LysR family transcriptional regulator [Pantoea sp. 18069]
MRLEDLEVFRAVHETGSFQRAGQRSGLTQSAVTKVIRKLEDEFGLQLLERGSGKAALTPAGRTLYARALELGRLSAVTRHDMASEAAALRGTIRLGVVPALLNSVVSPVIADLLAGPQAVQIHLIVKPSIELVHLVEEAKLDLAVCFGVQHVQPQVARTLVGRQRYRLVVRSGHPLAGTAPGLEELSRLRWLLPDPEVTLRAEIDRMFADAGFGALDVRVETDSSATLLIPLLAKTDLVAVLAEQKHQPLSAHGLAALNVDLAALVGDAAIYYRRQTPSVGVLMNLKSRLEAQARSNFPN